MAYSSVDIRTPERFQEKFAGALQHYIDGYVAEGVVDGLEVVDINYQHAERQLVAFVVVEDLLAVKEERLPIVDVGKRIGLRLLLGGVWASGGDQGEYTLIRDRFFRTYQCHFVIVDQLRYTIGEVINAFQFVDQFHFNRIG